MTGNSLVDMLVTVQEAQTGLYSWIKQANRVHHHLALSILPLAPETILEVRYLIGTAQ